MRRSRWMVTVVLLAVCVSFAGRRVSGQFRYWSGQNVVPVFEGWERNPDGSLNFVFGYFNRNYEEALDVLVGPDNNIEPGGPDRGQPTFFAPARQKFLFRVKVPKDWPIDRRLVWTLTVRGKTEKANAFLLPEWEMNSQVMALNGAGGGGGGIDEDYNQPPVISFAGPVSAAFPGGTSVIAAVTDDGVPKPRAARRGGPPRAPLLRVAWLQFRGPVGGRVSFSPGTSTVVDGKAETVATATMAGQYSLLGVAMDGAASSTATVTVNAGARR